MTTKTVAEVGKVRVMGGDALEVMNGMPEESVQCVVTSPPYWGLRDYGVEGQLGLEKTPGEYIEKCVRIFRGVRRVLRSDGTVWVNMGDGYNGQGARAPNIKSDGSLSYRAGGLAVDVPDLKPKDLIGMPWRLAFALQVDGWYLRQDIIWSKTNAMPESVTDRCTKSHEYIFLLSKSENYFFDAEAIKEKASTNTHSRGGGINPKAKRAGQHSRMREDRDPRHLARPRSKQNASFSGMVNDIVTHRNKRSVWTMATAPFPKAHFATFPPSLPRFCIKAGTSAHGCCSVCGRPFQRIVERYDTGLRQKTADGWDTGEGAHGTIHRQGREDGKPDQPVLATRTIGWESECCRLFSSAVEPCVVMDPFAGAFTTCMVASELGRRSIGIELKPDYIELGIERLSELL